MFTATDVLPVLALVVFAVLVALPRHHEPDNHLPRQQYGEQPGEPLPPDQRAHLAWVADHTDSAEVRRRALELLAVDDRRRGLDSLRRPGRG